MEEKKSTIFDVLGGREAVKAEVSIPQETILLLGAVILFIVVTIFALKKI